MILRPTIALAAGFWLLTAALSKAEPIGPLTRPDAATTPIVPVVLFGADGRRSAEDFAREHSLNAGALRRRYRASGVVVCGNARGAGQLTLVNSVVTTAAHVFFDEAGRPRALGGRCRFIVEIGRTTIAVAIDPTSIVSGSRDPYAETPARDWAVARLERAIAGAVPYRLGQAGDDMAVRFAARGHVDWGGGVELALEQCRLRQTLDVDAGGAREVAFDCDAGQGASGGALLDKAGERLVAIFVGYRSSTPDLAAPFSGRHYNFAVTVEGAFRRAIEAEAGATAAER